MERCSKPPAGSSPLMAHSSSWQCLSLARSNHTKSYTLLPSGLGTRSDLYFPRVCKPSVGRCHIRNLWMDLPFSLVRLTMFTNRTSRKTNSSPLKTSHWILYSQWKEVVRVHDFSRQLRLRSADEFQVNNAVKLDLVYWR